MKVCFLILLLALPAFAAKVAIDFKADYYQRDLGTNTVRGKGNAWVKRGELELWADEIELDLGNDRVIARGNVHLKDKFSEIWCSYADYDLKGVEALLEDAVLSTAQVVISGTSIKKLSPVTFEIDHGSYSNCNVDSLPIKSVSSCDFDWKVYGSKLSVTLGGYGSVRDGIFYFKSLPVVYIPYLVFPIKTTRQSGMLMPYATYIAHLGTGWSVPVFLALGSWHDLTFTPTLYLKQDANQFMLRTEYRYVHSALKSGTFNFAFTTKRFSTDRNQPGIHDPTLPRAFGLVGEWSLDVHNEYAFEGRGRSRQTIHAVRDPYWLVEYGQLPIESGLGYLRSLVNYSLPSDTTLVAAQIAHHQSLVMPEDGGSDNGAVTRFPELFFSKSNDSIFGRYLTYELNTKFANYTRGSLGYDQIPTVPNATGNPGDDPAFDSNDYIRTGQRLLIEPSLVGNVPLPPGFQMNPALRFGGIFYHFDYPQSTFLSREYIDFEIPLSLYFTKKFETGIPGLEKVSHVFQPRVIYASNLYHDEEENSATFQSQFPFFFQNSSLSNPRFDISDRITPFQYFRFELINRFRRMTPQGPERFFFLKLSEQYNIRRFDYDSRYFRSVGPIEILGEFTMGRVSAQMQGTFELVQVNGIRENDWSGSLIYRSPDGDNITSSVLFRKRADSSATEESIRFQGYKVLPTFFDLTGSFEYSAKRGEFVSYGLGFSFASKPKSCWRLDVVTGRDALKRPFANLQFNLNFGGNVGTKL